MFLGFCYIQITLILKLYSFKMQFLEPSVIYCFMMYNFYDVIIFFDDIYLIGLYIYLCQVIFDVAGQGRVRVSWQ